MIQFISKTFNLFKTFNPIHGGKNMKKSLSIILNLLLILSIASFGYAEEYVYVTKWTPDGNPRGMATDSDGNVYIAGEQKVVKYTSEGALVFTIENIANNDDYNLSSWDMAVAVDSSGYIYVSNEQDHNIVKFDSTGTYVTKWGSQGSEDGEFSEPKGIALSNGYICSSYIHPAIWLIYTSCNIKAVSCEINKYIFNKDHRPIIWYIN